MKNNLTIKWKSFVDKFLNFKIKFKKSLRTGNKKEKLQQQKNYKKLINKNQYIYLKKKDRIFPYIKCLDMLKFSSNKNEVLFY